MAVWSAWRTSERFTQPQKERIESLDLEAILAALQRHDFDEDKAREDVVVKSPPFFGRGSKTTAGLICCWQEHLMPEASQQRRDAALASKLQEDEFKGKGHKGRRAVVKTESDEGVTVEGGHGSMRAAEEVAPKLEGQLVPEEERQRMRELVRKKRNLPWFCPPSPNPTAPDTAHSDLACSALAGPGGSAFTGRRSAARRVQATASATCAKSKTKSKACSPPLPPAAPDSDVSP